MSQLKTIFALSFRDYSHEWKMSGCFIIALASVLAPMMILFGLKFGIVNSMVSGLVENPSNREIRPIGSGAYRTGWFKTMKARDDVAFIIPKTRALAATIQLKSDSAPRILSTELIATEAGDPLLQNVKVTPTGYFQVILSHNAAQKLKVKKGDRIDASLSRQFRGKREREHIDVRVIAVADSSVTSRNIAYISLDLLVASENFKDGKEVLKLGWDGHEHDDNARDYPSFRLFTHSIYQVEDLVNELQQQGIRVKSNTTEIKTIQSIDKNLSIIFWIIACVGAVGFSLSLGASLWANVDRKKKDLSILRLVGFQGGKIVLFPVLQSFYTGILGWLVAVLIYLLTETIINSVLAPELGIESVLCFLLPEHFFWALALTLCTAVFAAILGGYRASNIEPSDGLRDI